LAAPVDLLDHATQQTQPRTKFGAEQLHRAARSKQLDREQSWQQLTGANNENHWQKPNLGRWITESKINSRNMKPGAKTEKHESQLARN
jgi:hypothetical protein